MTISVDAHKFGFNSTVSSLLLRDGNFLLIHPPSRLTGLSSRYRLFRVCHIGDAVMMMVEYSFFHSQGPDSAEYHEHRCHKGKAQYSLKAFLHAGFLTSLLSQLGPVSAQAERSLSPFFTTFCRPVRYMAPSPCSYNRAPTHPLHYSLQTPVNLTLQITKHPSYQIFP
jgi:hypothetical protein